MLIISRSIEQYKDNQLLLNLQIFKQLFFKKKRPRRDGEDASQNQDLQRC